MMKTIRNMDWILFGSFIGLIATGLFALNMAAEPTHGEMWQTQAGFVAAGFGISVLLCFVPLRIFQRISWLLYGITLLGMVLVWRIGWKVHSGFLHDYFLQSASAEFMLWTLIFVLAAYFSTHNGLDWKRIFIPLLLIAMPMTVSFNQFGLVLMLSMLLIAILMSTAAAQWRLLVVGTTGLVAFISVLWPFMHHYQRERLLTWKDDQLSPMDDYGLLQTMGEFGVVAISLSLLLTGLLIWRIFIIASRADDYFAKLLCVGIAPMAMLYLMLNIGLATGAFSVFRILQPFVSYDGLKLVALIAVIGLVMRIAIEANESGNKSTSTKIPL